MDTASFDREFDALIAAHRSECLWFCRGSMNPRERPARLRILEAVERYGDRDAFIETRKPRQWLLLHSSSKSAASGC